jgi:hypothetical protein
MADKIADFLAGMADDPSKVEAFKKNPDAQLAQSGLSKEQRRLLKSGDHEQIRSAITAESGPDAIAVMFETLPPPPPPPPD